MATINETTAYNDTWSTAQTINNGDTVNGTITAGDSQDWYKISFSQSGYANFYLHPVSTSLDVDLLMGVVESSTFKRRCYRKKPAGQNELVRYFPVQSNTYYYMKVAPYNSTGSYQLSSRVYSSFSPTYTTGAMATSFPAGPFFNDNPLAAGYTGECTWYCWGRAREKTNINNLPTANAGSWYSSASSDFYKTTSTQDPVTDSIACYSGHVVYVEEVCNGIVYFSEANWYSVGDSRRSNGQYEVPPYGTDGQIKSASISSFKNRSSGYQGCIVL